MIELKNINHFYGKFHSLKNISIQVPRGSITGLIGQNGAGKSTLLKILAGFLVPETGSHQVASSGGTVSHQVASSGGAGEVFVDGLSYRKEPMAVRSRIGYMPETPLLYREMKVGEYLDFVGKLKRLGKQKRASECERLIPDCGLGQIYHKLIGSLSKGNRQRVALAQALMGAPPVLLLDEPTSALDPAQAIEIRRIIQGQKEKPPGGKGAVLMSSHVLSEISAVCDRIIFISAGEIRFQGSIDSFKGESLESLFK